MAVRAEPLEGDDVDHAAVRLHLLRDRLREGAEDQRHDHVAGDVAPAGGEGRLRVQDRVLRRAHPDRGHRALIVRHLRHGQALDRVAGHRARIAQRHVDAAVDGRGSPREIEADAASRDLGAAGEPESVVDPLDVDRAFVGAVRNRGDPVADGPLALIADGRGQRGEVVEPVLVHELEELTAADLVAGDVRHEVPEDLLGHPHVAAYDLEHRLVELAAAHELADGKAEALVEYLGRGGAEAEPADVRQVGDAHGVADETPVAKHRSHHIDVKEVTGAHPRVVGGDDVARLQGFRRELREHVAQGGRGRAGERGDAVAALRDGVALGVEDHHREVAALAHDGGERAPDEGGDDLVGDPDEPIPHDREADRVDLSGVHDSSPTLANSATRLSRSSTSARSPGPSTQVDSRSSMTAGPPIDVPGSRA